MKDQKQLLLKSLKNDVPVFVLCGTDENAVETLHQYFEIAKKNGCDNAFLQDMKLAIEDFKVFQKQEPEKVKLPDMSPQIEESIFKSTQEHKSFNGKEQFDKPQYPIETILQNEINEYIKKQNDKGINEDINNRDLVSPEFLKNYFSQELKMLNEFYELPKDVMLDFSHLSYEAEYRMQIKAGEILEAWGYLPKGSSESKIAEEGVNVVFLKEKINNERLSLIVESNNALGTIYELFNNDEKMAHEFVSQNGIGKEFFTAELSAIEVNDYSLYASNFFDTYPDANREDLDRSFAMNEEKAKEDNNVLKHAISDKIISPTVNIQSHKKENRILESNQIMM
jgi:hypothetical protein